MEGKMAEISIDDVNIPRECARGVIGEVEREYFRKIELIADEILRKDDINVVLIAGPSGSGKTTTANLIADEIKKRGDDAPVISLDDFYRLENDENYPKKLNGEKDYESPLALDIDLFTEITDKILKKEPFEVTKYDFKTGERKKGASYLPLRRGCVIIEGLHALNPIFAGRLPKERAIKIFISVSTNVNADGKRILSGRKVRFIRRLVRDKIYRGASAERTLAMWKNVTAAEDIYLYPYKETADFSFDTFHRFELGVLREYALKFIPKSLFERDLYLECIVSALKQITPVNPSLVPEDSLIREFISGGIYDGIY